MKSLRSFFCFFLVPCLTFSQITIKGAIKDNSTQQSIPFVSIGIIGTLQSTLSDDKGNFELIIPHLTDTDTLRISSIGYNNLSIAGGELKKNPVKIFYLQPMVYELSEVKVKPKKAGFNILGTRKYSKDVCTAFVGENNNWRGEQAAIRANNKEGTTVYLESFNFYIIKNEYSDSLQFRLMLYEVNPPYGYPGKTFLKKPIIFKTNVKQGEVQVDLTNYFISVTGDFFISLECLEQKIEAGKFCFAGSIKVPSFVKTTPYAKWHRVKGGGGDFNVKVSYDK